MKYDRITKLQKLCLSVRQNLDVSRSEKIRPLVHKRFKVTTNVFNISKRRVGLALDLGLEVRSGTQTKS